MRQSAFYYLWVWAKPADSNLLIDIYTRQLGFSLKMEMPQIGSTWLWVFSARPSSENFSSNSSLPFNLYPDFSMRNQGEFQTSWAKQKTGTKNLLSLNSIYSRVHKSWNRFFSKILEKPSIVQKKNYTSYKQAGFFTEMKQKKKIKMTASKKPHFPAPPVLNIFSWKFHGLVLGLVELIDAKGIDFAQSIWPWGWPT